MKFRGSLLLSATLVVALLTVACAQPTASGPGQEVDVSEQSLSALDYLKSKQTWVCDEGKEHWRTTGTPVRGGTFIKATTPSSSTAGLDTSAPGGSHSAVQVYEHLVETRACFYEDSVMVPGLAKSWQGSADGLTWTLKIDEKAKWQNVPPVNGRPFTSADVAWMIEHQKRDGQLRSTWAPVEHEEPDPLTIILKLKDPDPDFLGNVLGERNNVMMPREVKEQFGDFKSVAVGTGAYTVKEYKNNQNLILERTPDWRKMGADNKPLPYIDRLEFPVFGDYAAEIAAMRAGQLDLNQTLGYLKRDYDALTEANPKLKSYRDIAPIPRGLWLNHKVKPFDDINVRKALFYGTNADEVIALAFQGGGVRSGFLPTAITQYAWPVDKVLEMFKPDPEKAKEYLAKSGYGPGNPLTFTMKMGNSPQDQGGEVVQEQLKQIGVEVKVDVVTNVAATSISQRAFDAGWSGVSPASIFPDRWMGGFLRCGDSRNFTQVCDSEVDRLSTAQGKELDPIKRKVLIDQLQQRLFDLSPWVPQMSLVYYRLYSCRVKNVPSTDYTQQLTGVPSAWLDDKGC